MGKLKKWDGAAELYDHGEDTGADFNAMDTANLAYQLRRIETARPVGLNWSPHFD